MIFEVTKCMIEFFDFLACFHNWKLHWFWLRLRHQQWWEKCVAAFFVRIRNSKWCVGPEPTSIHRIYIRTYTYIDIAYMCIYSGRNHRNECLGNQSGIIGNWLWLIAAAIVICYIYRMIVIFCFSLCFAQQQLTINGCFVSKDKHRTARMKNSRKWKLQVQKTRTVVASGYTGSVPSLVRPEWLGSGGPTTKEIE